MSDILFVVGLIGVIVIFGYLVYWIERLQDQLDQKTLMVESLERELKEWKNYSRETHQHW